MDDLPEYHESHELSQSAQDAFEAAVKSLKLFLIPRKDNYDYGTDYQLEAKVGKAVTNFRAHVQLKGSETAANKDGSVSVSVRRANLNYLLAQSDALYVCWHAPTGRLLVSYVADVFREYEHRGPAWRDNSELTVRFHLKFDKAFLRRFHAQILASGESNRDRRLDWLATPPEEFPTFIAQSVALVEVPTDPQRAYIALQHLYHAGKDAAISSSFSRFEAVLKKLPGAMIPAYLAEINLGINRRPFDRRRVQNAVRVIQSALKKKQITIASGRYCQGNAWLALGELTKARDCYIDLLRDKKVEMTATESAQCLKNLGSVMDALGDHRAAYEHFCLALERDPNLPEAQMAVAICGMKNGLDVREALLHLDTIGIGRGTPVSISSIQGWRIEFLFQLGDSSAAFREVQALVAVADQVDWIWPYCAGKVADFGRVSIEAARNAVNFWRAYLHVHPAHPNAEAEMLLCLAMLRAHQIPTGITFDTFRESVERLDCNGIANAALLWDRAGHWAQDDGDWQSAESCYRRAYNLAKGSYGYCLGVALNSLGRYDESLPLLREQASVHQPDAQSWFQVAVAKAGSADIDGSITAYQRALELDPHYDLAWFNLGGMYWNNRDIENARKIWKEAISRFPEHPQAVRIAKDFSALFTDNLPHGKTH